MDIESRINQLIEETQKTIERATSGKYEYTGSPEAMETFLKIERRHLKDLKWILEGANA